MMFDDGSGALAFVDHHAMHTSRRRSHVRQVLEISNRQVRLIGMVSAGRHPKNAINAVIGDLPDNIEVVPIHKGHRWGVLGCATCDATEAIWSTPRSADNHARGLLRFVARHLHDEEG
ncbi:hypothetical protein [Promicromonospora sp. AC04]|uniref:hypothetical protein n=1 Tax=Promicromonospora sp. AC04 TaxID=2135723 RepID=UPI0011B264E7|nr:hypothetical protein [Promicromonospora sp. AC04]